MEKHKKEKKRPPFGLPKEIVLLATPEGWRHSVFTEDGAMVCGRLDVPPHTDPQEARAAATAMLTGLARDFHGTDVEVNWGRPSQSGSWTAQVTRAAGNEPASPVTGD